MFSAMLVLLGAREAGCFREVAAMYSDHHIYCTQTIGLSYIQCTISPMYVLRTGW